MISPARKHGVVLTLAALAWLAAPAVFATAAGEAVFVYGAATAKGRDAEEIRFLGKGMNVDAGDTLTTGIRSVAPGARGWSGSKTAYSSFVTAAFDKYTAGTSTRPCGSSG